MTKLTIEIKMDNAAVTDEYAVAMLLQKAAGEIEYGKRSGTIIDANGNLVGKYRIK